MTDLHSSEPIRGPEVALALAGTRAIMMTMSGSGTGAGAPRRPPPRRFPRGFGRRFLAFRGVSGGRAPRRAVALAVVGLALAASGCSTAHPKQLSPDALVEARTFPYYRLYWVGPSFQGRPLAAADGLKGYINSVGDSVYYGDCVHGKGIFGGGSCILPLQVTTVIYRLHSNATLGPQRNIVVRGVPAVVYDEGRSIELYTGRVAVDIFSDGYARALAAANELLPANAPGSRGGRLPPPVYCPGLSGPVDASVRLVMENLPGHVCQQARTREAFAEALSDRD
jgi:hypothetical protein